MTHDIEQVLASDGTYIYFFSTYNWFQNPALNGTSK